MVAKLGRSGESVDRLFPRPAELCRPLGHELFEPFPVGLVLDLQPAAP